MFSNFAYLLTIFVFICSTTATLYEVFVPCCHEGVKWSDISYRCDNYPAPVVNISDNDQAACIAIIEVCCIKQTQVTTCEDGKQTALDGQACAIRDSDPGSEQFRECCQCCHLGLESRLAQPACQTPGLGEPCDSKYKECCLGEESILHNFTGIEPQDKSQQHSTISPMTVEVDTSEQTIDGQFTTDAPTANMTTKSYDIGRQGKCRDGHDCSQRCVDSLDGTKKCQCWDGYRLERDGKTCKDIDECLEGSGRCSSSQRCVNTVGRYTCLNTRCLPGFSLSERTGRCEFDPENCQKGYAYNTVTGGCEDLNECGLGIDSCKVGERCENTVGSYHCRRIRHCGTGYTMDDATQRCEDNNECTLGTHNCRGGYQCQNLQGTFRCVPKTCNSTSRFDHIKGECVPINCPKGFESNSARACVDVNECTQPGRPACRRFQKCINTRGSFYCRTIVNCPPGYEATNTDRCQDIDECAIGTHKCGPDQQCINRQGTYFCQCPRGLRHDNERRCIDVDECSYGASICPSNSKCVNTQGSFECECVDGLQNGDGDKCTDIDECAQQGICQQSCVNVLGTFFCTCDRGYQLRDDKRSCEDIDECTQFGGRGGRSGVCGGRCVNIPGSYKCECTEGWRLKDDGRSCEDINECQERTAYCPLADSLCINTRGGFKCPVVTCPEGFLKTNSTGQQNSIRCKRISTTCPECRRGLISRSFNFLSFASNVLVPAPLFSMTGSRLVDKFYTWQLELLSARPTRAGVAPATYQHFSLEKSRDFARVTLVKRVEGPQDVVLQLDMNVTNYYKGFEGKAQSHIHLYISEEDQH